MSKKVVLPQPKNDYDKNLELLKNRELELAFRQLFQKIAELEERIKALEP